MKIRLSYNSIKPYVISLDENMLAIAMDGIR